MSAGAISKTGVYATRRGEIAYITKVTDERLFGIVAATPERAKSQDWDSRYFEMNWNRKGALSDFDHSPYTPGCLISSSYRPFNTHDQALLSTFVDDLA